MIQRLFETWSRWILRAQQRWRWVGYAFTLLAFVYLAALIIVSRESIQEVQWQRYWLPFILSILIYLASLLIQFTVWSRLVSFHHRTSWRDLAIYFRVLLMRRLPGGVWHWVDRTAMYTGTTSVPAKVVVLANFLEWTMLLLLAGAYASLGWLSWAPWLRVSLAMALIAAALYLGYAWQPAGRKGLWRMVESLFWVILYTLAWMAGGLILYLFVHTAQAGMDLTSAGYLPLSYLHGVWAWAIAGGSSQLMVFIPAGLGIREITLTWLLSPNLPLPSILLVAIVIRLTYALADVVWGAFGMLFSLRLLKAQSAVEISQSE
jgi:hypothetical protein